MNDNLIRRAASVFRSWLISQVSEEILSRRKLVMSNIHSSCEKMIQIKEWSKRFFDGNVSRVQLGPDEERYIGIVSPQTYANIATDMVPNLGDDVLLDVAAAIHSMKRIGVNPSISHITPKEAFEEVNAINGAWDDVKFRNSKLSVLIKDVRLEHDGIELELGDFWIHLNLKRPDSGLAIEPLGDNESYTGLHHPHVQNGHLCVGAGTILVSEALNQGRLEDYFRLIESILRTYNEGGAYEGGELYDWNEPNREDQYYCEYCDQWVCNEDTIYCDACQDTACTECETSQNGGCCTECGNWRCGNCVTNCSGCDNTLCSEGCLLSCSCCAGTFCSSCVKSCTICDNSCMCDECTHSCEYCGDDVCGDCITTCQSCEKTCCTSCVDESCADCSKQICQDCQTTCNECSEIMCTGCGNNTCDGCGTTMCCSCKNDHECLLQETTG